MSAPSDATTDATTKTATHYEVLGLSPSMLDAVAQDPSQLIKQAYRRTLLRNHPDKTASASSPREPIYTVDQISHAFAVLASPTRRAEYDASLRLALPAPGPGPTRFQTGVEMVDLDDLAFDDDRGRWYRPCRCGNDRGYSFDEADLADAADDGLLMVGCLDCSLWLSVHFAAVDDDELRPK
ncbi:hypothetical protein CDD80_7268 [Ophiocordyceps camponoti-rufipedis]|uniref:Diphthamide biosynthesis protein 4 n=1 Tax=Ophiocordyceps camponoti-rufipedis TaxID=2004952 RepID=A0A2C5YP18_9HYPO|nr:hypothetical protein CDD80_7268 [Ophiocordyceps camponoti-rufipedis]